MKKESKISNRINQLLDIPKDTNGIETKITILNFNEMLIENFKGIIDYEEFYIRLKIDIGLININGFNLNLEQITQDDVMIKGKIEGIDLERI